MDVTKFRECQKVRQTIHENCNETKIVQLVAPNTYFTRWNTLTALAFHNEFPVRALKFTKIITRDIISPHGVNLNNTSALLTMTAGEERRELFGAISAHTGH